MYNKRNFINKQIYRTIILLVLEFVAVIVPVIILGSKFNFPDILRQPAENAFTLFKQNQSAIIFGYYIFVISSLLYIPLSYSLHKTLINSKSKFALQIFKGLGITTAIFQCIGFIRWIFMMPFLTKQYFEHPEQKNTIALIYETLNLYAGTSIGEHLGFIAMGFWTICLGIIIIKHPNFNKLLGYTAIFIGILLLVSLAEGFVKNFASIFGQINFIANTLWSIWILILCWFLYKLKEK